MRCLFSSYTRVSSCFCLTAGDCSWPLRVLSLLCDSASYSHQISQKCDHMTKTNRSSPNWKWALVVLSNCRGASCLHSLIWRTCHFCRLPAFSNVTYINLKMKKVRWNKNCNAQNFWKFKRVKLVLGAFFSDTKSPDIWRQHTRLWFWILRGWSKWIRIVFAGD